MYLTIPNLLTLLRILVVPVFAIAVWYGQLVLACSLFAAAGLTDMLDGFVARRFNQFSPLGAFLDPMADKLLMATAFVLLCMPSQHLRLTIPAWVVILAITRDVIISLFAFLASSNYDPSRFTPSLLGKITTGTEIVVIFLTLLGNALAPVKWLDCFFPWSFYLVAALVIASGLHYFARASGAPRAS
ncbi:MAG: CDP-alcohol phosphatidyltransferase family protein [Holophagales bacterium]|jgi:cardiolipin synthase|nr:CDP-alcohol phosphatidyltransferase family protein [Holophagales bacterium]